MPAMPQSGTEGVSGGLNSSEDWGGKGLTKLDHFSGLAMQGILSNSFLMEDVVRNNSSSDKIVNLVALMSNQHAKALLQQLEESE